MHRGELIGAGDGGSATPRLFTNGRPGRESHCEEEHCGHYVFEHCDPQRSDRREEGQVVRQRRDHSDPDGHDSPAEERGDDDGHDQRNGRSRSRHVERFEERDDQSDTAQADDETDERRPIAGSVRTL